MYKLCIYHKYICIFEKQIVSETTEKKNSSNLFHPFYFLNDLLMEWPGKLFCHYSVWRQDLPI